MIDRNRLLQRKSTLGIRTSTCKGPEVEMTFKKEGKGSLSTVTKVESSTSRGQRDKKFCSKNESLSPLENKVTKLAIMVPWCPGRCVTAGQWLGCLQLQSCFLLTRVLIVDPELAGNNPFICKQRPKEGKVLTWKNILSEVKRQMINWGKYLQFTSQVAGSVSTLYKEWLAGGVGQSV